MAKERKTAAELAALAMAEIAKFPECEEIQSVAIIRPVSKNWDASVVRNGPYITPASITHVDQIVQSLRAQFDLVKQSATATQLVNMLIDETSKELGRDATFLRNQITLRRRPSSDGTNWDANCGISAPVVIAAFGHALNRVQDSYDLEV